MLIIHFLDASLVYIKKILEEKLGFTLSYFMALYSNLKLTSYHQFLPSAIYLTYRITILDCSKFE